MHKAYNATEDVNADVCYEVLYRRQVTDVMNISFCKLGEEECEQCVAYELHA